MIGQNYGAHAVLIYYSTHHCHTIGGWLLLVLFATEASVHRWKKRKTLSTSSASLCYTRDCMWLLSMGVFLLVLRWRSAPRSMYPKRKRVSSCIVYLPGQKMASEPGQVVIKLTYPNTIGEITPDQLQTVLDNIRAVSLYCGTVHCNTKPRPFWEWLVSLCYGSQCDVPHHRCGLLAVCTSNYWHLSGHFICKSCVTSFPSLQEGGGGGCNTYGCCVLSLTMHTDKPQVPVDTECTISRDSYN